MKRVKRRFAFLAIGDMALVVLAIMAAFFLRYGSFPRQSELLGLWGMKLVVFFGVVLFSGFLLELYSHEKNGGRKVLLLRVAIADLMSFIFLSAIYFLLPDIMFGRGILFLSLLSLWFFQSLWHLGFRHFLCLPALARRVLILGTGPLADKMGGLLHHESHQHVLAGYVNCVAEPVNVPVGSIVGNGGGLMDTVRKARADKIVVSLSERRGAFPLSDVLSCKLSGVQVVDAPSFYEEVTGKLLIENITPSWFIFSDGFRITAPRLISKRCVDVLYALLGLAVFLPLFPLVAFLIKIDSKGPVLFRQVRVGQGEKNFVLFKFRTMRSDAERITGAIWALKDDPRITRVGRLLRKCRLDELPQLYNVLKGDMSFIGPRPERPVFVEKLKSIIPYYSERHVVKPGITGWAQVKYPYGSTVEDAIEKLRYDLYYIKHLGPFLDLLIVLETIKVVLFGKGAR